MEIVARPEDVQHPIVREALKLVDLGTPHVEIVSMSDIPAGTGLGSSGSFTTALLRALHSAKRNNISSQELAEQACHIELDLLGEPIGKQDQYIASFGGISCFEFRPDDSVTVTPLRLDPMTLHNLEDNLALFFTSQKRDASAILKDQDVRSKQDDQRMFDNLHRVKQLGYESKAAFESGDLRRFAEIMHVHWENKKKRSAGMSTGLIDEYYDLAPKERRPGRQADRRRRRRLPHVLHRGQDPSAARDVRSGLARGAVPVRLRRDPGAGPVVRL